MKNYIVVLSLLFFSCASKKNNDVYVETIPNHLLTNENRFDLDNKIYPVDREILYSCTIQKGDEVLDLNLKYIKLTIQGTTKPFSEFDSDYSQTVIKFEYLDENYDRIIWERTGLIENDNNIWMHPPRNGDLGILQLSAFPYIKFGATKRWKWKLDAAYSTYQDVHLTHSYVKGNSIEFKGNVCIPIEATSKSHIGTTTSEFFYNKSLGFVQLKFHTIENETITLEMIEYDMGLN